MHGHDYSLAGDEFYDLCGPDYLARGDKNPQAITNLARLVATRRRLDAGYRQVIWMDADMFVFDPKRLVFDFPAKSLTTGYAFGREVWFRRAPMAGPQARDPTAHNAATYFTDAAVDLDMLISLIRHIDAHRRIVSNFQVGVKLLQGLQYSLMFPTFSHAAVFSPDLLRALVQEDEDALRLYGQAFRYHACAANLCLHMQDQSSQQMLWRAMDRLDAGEGEAINKYAAEPRLCLSPFDDHVDKTPIGVRTPRRLTVRMDEPVGETEEIERDGSLPDFLIVGAVKSGTTALSFNLNRHPDVSMAGSDGQPRETHFFNSNWRRGVDWYRKYFTRPDKLQGEKTPDYLSILECHARMASIVPNAKLIISLRNPIDRAYSQWNHFNQIAGEAKNWGWCTMPFAEAIEQRHIPVMNSLLASGNYVTEITHLLKYYRRDKIHIIIADRLRAHGEDEYLRLLTFLGLPPSPAPFKNVHVREYSEPLDAGLRQYLASYFAESNTELFSFLGDRVPEWD